MADRLKGCVPFCKRTRRPTVSDPEEWLCTRHYAGAESALRVEYDAAWHAADKEDGRMADGMEPNLTVYQRVCTAWEAVKTSAIEMAHV